MLLFVKDKLLVYVGGNCVGDVTMDCLAGEIYDNWLDCWKGFM